MYLNGIEISRRNCRYEDDVKNTKTRLEFNFKFNFNFIYNVACYINVQFLVKKLR
jgi:hypothetical protein